jgi:hypothetical protein
VSGPAPIPAVGDPDLDGDDNRTSYLFVDADPALQLGNSYWYQVRWVDLAGVEHPQPAARADFGEAPYLAILNYGVAHNEFDHDVTATIGWSAARDPGNSDWATLGDGTSGADTVFVLEPANAGTATLGYLEHYWSLPLRPGEGFESVVPPSPSHPWFLSLEEGGYVNRMGRITAFSMFVPYDPSGTSGYVVATGDPLPMPTLETQSVTVWLETTPASSEAARLFTESVPEGIRIVLEVPGAVEHLPVVVSRSLTREPKDRTAIDGTVREIAPGYIEILDTGVVEDQVYYYWIEFTRGEQPVLGGPVAGRHGGLRTGLSLVSANPLAAEASLRYTVGADAATNGSAAVRAAVYDVNGREIKRLLDGARAIGTYSLRWDGRDATGSVPVDGVYFVRLQAGPVTESVKITVLR